MRLTQVIEHANQALPQPLHTGINWGAFTAAVGYVFTGIVPAIVGVLSAIWLGCQIWLFFRTKPWRKNR